MATDYRRGIEGFAFGIRDSAAHLEKLALAQSDKVDQLRAGLKEALAGWETWGVDTYGDSKDVAQIQARIAELRALLE